MKNLEKFAASLVIVGSIIAYFSLSEFTNKETNSLLLAERGISNETSQEYANYVSRYSKNYKNKNEYKKRMG